MSTISLYGAKAIALETVLSLPESTKRLGSMPGALALGSADIGRVELLSGKVVYCTWGRNIDKKEQEWFLQHTTFQPVWVGANDGSAELILDNETAESLLPLLVAKSA